MLFRSYCISECSGIRIFGKRIKSIAFSTDVAIIKNINADAIIAVYPFTPQAAISQSIISISDVPVFVGCPLRGECKSDKIICAPKFNSKLSDRQLEVMRLLYEGKSDSEIADKLFISLNTVNNHRKNSFRKVGVHSFPEFMRYAMQNNLFK